MIITIQFYRISIPQPQRIPLPTEVSPLETVSISKSVSQYLLCKQTYQFVGIYIDNIYSPASHVKKNIKNDLIKCQILDFLLLRKRPVSDILKLE